MDERNTGRGYSPGNRNQHQGGLTDTWLTPPGLIEALGPFDTDVCCPDDPMPWRTADRMIRKSEDCFTIDDWKFLHFKWCNPPYGKEQWRFIEKMAEAGNGIALIRARTNVEAFHRWAWEDENAADWLFFGAGGKLTFHSADGVKHKNNDPLPYVLLGWGDEARSRILGAMGAGKIRGTFLGNAKKQFIPEYYSNSLGGKPSEAVGLGLNRKGEYKSK